MKKSNNKNNKDVKYTDIAVTHLMKRRLFISFLFFIGVCCVIATRLIYLQIIQGDELSAKARNLQTKDITIGARRGTIYDRKKRVLAMSATVYTIYVAPTELSKEKVSLEYMADTFAKILVNKNNTIDKCKESILKKLKRKSACEIIAKKIDKSVADKIRNAKYYNKATKKYEKFPGVQILEDSKRYYAYSNFASHVLGITGDDNQGLFGIEKIQDKYLKGVPGRLILEAYAQNKELASGNQEYIKPKDGQNVILTIDEVIQHYADAALDQAMIENNATGATAIVMDPRTGEILALSNKPDFDLNSPYKPQSEKDYKIYRDKVIKQQAEAKKLKKQKLIGGLTTDMSNKEFKDLTIAQQNLIIQQMWRNFAISDTYEPGSPFKLITAAGALEEGVVKPEDTFVCNGYLMVGKRQIKCAKYPQSHGLQTFVQGLENSCNVVFMETGFKLKAYEFDKYVRGFGFDKKTNIDLTGETTGILMNPKDVTKQDLAVMSFGQTLTVTPIQMLTAVCGIANDGLLVQPHVVKEIVDNKNKIIKEVKTKVVKQVISKKVANELADMMEKVVSNGSGKNAKIDGYKIAGKTGTSEKQPRNQGKYIASFVGFAPADNPRVAILVLIDEPKGASHFGSLVAAPVFKSIMQDTLNYLRIPADNGSVKKQKQIIVPDYVGKKYEYVANDLKNKKMKSQIIAGSGDTVIEQFPSAGAKVLSNTKILLTLKKTNKKKLNKVIVPNLKGLTIEQANKLIAERGLVITSYGQNGVVESQSPVAGTEVFSNTEVIVTVKDSNIKSGSETGD